MKKHWEQCGRDPKPNRWQALHVTMNAKGHIALSRFTHETLGSPSAYHLFFDRLNSSIGLKPTAVGVKDAFPTSTRGINGARLIRGFPLCQKFNIRLADTIRFTDPEIDEDGLLNLDLRKVRHLKGKKSKGQNKDSEA